MPTRNASKGSGAVMGIMIVKIILMSRAARLVALATVNPQNTNVTVDSASILVGCVIATPTAPTTRMRLAAVSGTRGSAC